MHTHAHACHTAHSTHSVSIAGRRGHANTGTATHSSHSVSIAGRRGHANTGTATHSTHSHVGNWKTQRQAHTCQHTPRTETHFTHSITKARETACPLVVHSTHSTHTGARLAAAHSTHRRHQHTQQSAKKPHNKHTDARHTNARHTAQCHGPLPEPLQRASVAVVVAWQSSMSQQHPPLPDHTFWRGLSRRAPPCHLLCCSCCAVNPGVGWSGAIVSLCVFEGCPCTCMRTCVLVHVHVTVSACVCVCVCVCVCKCVFA